MMIDYKLIGERIKRYRCCKQFTQERLAERMDVSTTYISKIERGTAHVSLPRLMEICDILEVSINEVLIGTQADSEEYMVGELGKLLSDCPAELMPVIKEIIEVLIHSYPKG